MNNSNSKQYNKQDNDNLMDMCLALAVRSHSAHLQDNLSYCTCCGNSDQAALSCVDESAIHATTVRATGIVSPSNQEYADKAFEIVEYKATSVGGWVPPFICYAHDTAGLLSTRQLPTCTYDLHWHVLLYFLSSIPHIYKHAFGRKQFKNRLKQATNFCLECHKSETFANHNVTV